MAQPSEIARASFFTVDQGVWSKPGPPRHPDHRPKRV